MNCENICFGRYLYQSHRAEQKLRQKQPRLQKHQIHLFEPWEKEICFQIIIFKPYCSPCDIMNEKSDLEDSEELDFRQKAHQVFIDGDILTSDSLIVHCWSSLLVETIKAVLAVLRKILG